jgi:acyl-CoA thioesterase II
MTDPNTPDGSTPCPLEARAFVDEKLVAVSSNTLRVQRPGALPLLYFPRDQLREKLREGDDVLLPAVPAGYIAFDTSNPRVQVLLVDRVEGEPAREHTLVRFPTWGDAADLIKMLDVQPDGDKGYLSQTRDNAADPHRDVVEGSLMLAQAIVAAGRRAPGRRVVSATMMFMRAANTATPLRVDFDELSNGRNFTTLAPHVRQAGKLCASGVMLLDAKAPDVLRHSVAFPQDTSGPYASEFYDMSMTGRDLRFVDAAYSNDSQAPVGPPLIDAWVRFRRVPEDPVIHAALLAHFTGAVSIAAAMRPYAGIGQDQAHRTLSTAPNAITISFHADIRADRWMLYRHHSTFAGDGMTHSECRVYDVEGKLLASFSVEAMVRAMPTARPVDERTAL